MKKLLVSLLVAALMLGWGFGARQVQAAPNGPPPAVDFYIEVATAGCDTDGGSTTCDVPVGTSFMVTAQLKSYSGLPGSGDYIAFQARLDNSVGMPYVPRAGTAEIVWGQGVLPVESAGVDTYTGGDVTGIINPPPTNYLGPLMEVDYDCTASPSAGHTITMVHGVAGLFTLLVDDQSGQLADGDPDEVLTINCNEPTVPPPGPPVVGGIVGLMEDGQSPRSASGSSTSDYALPIAAVIAGAIMALAVGTWYARRRLLR